MKSLKPLASLLPLFFYACTAHAPVYAWEWPWEARRDVLSPPQYVDSSQKENASPVLSGKGYTQETLSCVAVALVILQRTKDSRYPNDVCSVIAQNEHMFGSCQFSYRCDGKSEVIRKDNNPAYNIAVSVSQCVLEGECGLLGISQATLYHACDGPNAVSPDWDKKKLRTMGKLQNHCFYKEV
jgi:spore germination cell wall hydrolase CwlJ-like protein